jgi:hypothetical protein
MADLTTLVCTGTLLIPQLRRAPMQVEYEIVGIDFDGGEVGGIVGGVITAGDATIVRWAR